MNIPDIREAIFAIQNKDEFRKICLEIFKYQSEANPVYKNFLNLLQRGKNEVHSIEEIPFLPVELFKHHKIITGSETPEIIFESSGTTDQVVSKHFVTDAGLYRKSLFESFKKFFGSPEQYCFLALLPSYLERKNASLVFMVQQLMEVSGHPLNGFFLHDQDELAKRLKVLEQKIQPVILFGVSFALLDLAEKFPMRLECTKIIETGGMKGKRQEITREEFHHILKSAFQSKKIYSEYGMTELLSQAYSSGDGKFSTPPWMKILIRDLSDPFSFLPAETTGGINIIDLANLHSCCFLQTSDVGKRRADGTFEVLGRSDAAEVRGCNLLYETL